MRSVLLSINPKWCLQMAKRKKTVEVRKTRPKADTPFKVYIYCTKGKRSELLKYNSWFANGRIIGEFTCDRIDEYETEFYPGDDLYQDISLVRESCFDDEKEYVIVTSNDRDDPNNCSICKDSCLSFDEIKKYVGAGSERFFGWHISDLILYDQPKKLSELCKFTKHKDGFELEQIERAPQSWCYLKK